MIAWLFTLAGVIGIVLLHDYFKGERARDVEVKHEFFNRAFRWLILGYALLGGIAALIVNGYR